MATNHGEYYRGVEAATRALATASAEPARCADAVHAAVAPLLTADGAACRAGCAHCCRFPVGVTFGEAVRLADALADDAALRAHVLAEAAATTTLDWAQLAGRPCPLLHDERCRVHGARPLPCRALASRDAAACERALHGATAVPRDDAAWWRGLGAGAALAAATAAPGHRELRAAVAALLLPHADPAAAFLTARGVPKA